MDFGLLFGSNKSFKFPAFLGNDALINEADARFLYLLFKIRNILTGCYISPYHAQGLPSNI